MGRGYIMFSNVYKRHAFQFTSRGRQGPTIEMPSLKECRPAVASFSGIRFEGYYMHRSILTAVAIFFLVSTSPALFKLATSYLGIKQPQALLYYPLCKKQSRFPLL